MLFLLVTALPVRDTYQAAESIFDNARMFYEATSGNSHMMIDGATVYFATQGKLASSSTNLKYGSLGYDVTLTGGGASMTFSVKKGGSLTERIHAQREELGYAYNLYEISTDKLIELAEKRAQATGDPAFNTIKKASEILVQMDGIMYTKQNDIPFGAIEEDGKGGLYESGEVFHLRNPYQLQTIIGKFGGRHDFKGFKEINDKLANHSLSIVYDAGANVNLGSGLSTKTFAYQDVYAPYAIYNSAGVIHDDHHILNTFKLRTISSFGLSKTGYYIEPGKEWKRADGATFSQSAVYNPKQILPAVAYGDKIVALYANWQPHLCTIVYNANGGSGSMTATRLYYDSELPLNKNLFTRTGYEFAGWNTRADGKGASYPDQKQVKNLITTTGTVTLYAQWEPCVYQITTDKQTGTGGTDNFWQKFGTGFFSNILATNIYKIGSITPPEKTGYDFQGYFSWIQGSGNEIVNSAGTITAASTYFTNHATIYANYEPKKFIVTFDMQGGSQGTIFANATYDAVYPTKDVEVPVWSGYRFLGYHTEPNGAGELIYNEFMVADKIYKELSDQTLYANWIDDVPPGVTINSGDKWTKQEIGMTVTGTDLGSGLKSMELYLINDDSTETLVAEAKDLDGANTHTLTFTNEKEGVIRYRAVATDIKDNVAESYNTVLFDITGPTGEVITLDKNGNTFYIEVDITDIKTGD